MNSVRACRLSDVGSIIHQQFCSAALCERNSSRRKLKEQTRTGVLFTQLYQADPGVNRGRNKFEDGCRVFS